MPEFKNQHYVPQMLLRSFSTTKKSVGTFVLDSGQLIRHAPIKNQCSEDYFYGKDGDFEAAFREDESRAHKLFQRIEANDLSSFTEDELVELKVFIYFQRWRTRRAVEESDANFDLSVKLELDRTGQRPFAHVDNSSVTYHHPGGPRANIAEAVLCMGAFADLELIFIVSDGAPFVLSDHPVVFYNDFVAHNRWLRGLPGATGLIAKGLQAFLPATPRVSVMLYDPNTYAMRQAERGVAVANARDVELLNGMQAINADECVYVSDEVTDESLTRLAEFRRRNAIPRTPHVQALPPVSDRSGGKKYMVASSAPWTPLRKRLSFCRITETYDYSKYRDSKVPIRDHRLVEFSKGMAGTFVDQIRQLAIASGQDPAVVERKLREILPLWDETSEAG